MRLIALGSNAALPTASRHLSAQLIQLADRSFLIDAGEGTQWQLQQARISVLQIDAIFISHMHGDHIFGLPGLISSMSLQNRPKNLDIYGPPELEEFLRHALRLSDARMSFTWKFHSVSMEKHCLLNEDRYEVHSIPLQHRTPCRGYIFYEKFRQRNIRKEALAKYQLSHDEIRRLKNSEEVIRPDGQRLPLQEICYDLPATKSYAYCSDTLYVPENAKYLQGIGCLYHEATFLEEHKQKALDTFHSTAAQAALLAREAGVGELLLGHFSSRYLSLEEHEKEARAIFAKTRAIEELVWYEL